MSKRTVRDAKAQATHEAAMWIIDREKTASDAKTARLKQLREAHAASQPKKSPAKRKAGSKSISVSKSKSIPVSKLSADNDG